MNSAQTPTTVIGLMAQAMTVYNTEQLIDIIRTIEAGAQTEDERIIKFAAHEVIENRHPEIGPILDSRIDEELTYTDLVVDVLRNLNHIN